MQVRPDPKLAAELEAAETARLEAARSAMSTEELEAAVRETEELRRRQARRSCLLVCKQRMLSVHKAKRAGKQGRASVVSKESGSWCQAFTMYILPQCPVQQACYSCHARKAAPLSGCLRCAGDARPARGAELHPVPEAV